MNSWFTVKVKYTKQLEDGRLKRVNEPYLFNAMTFSDAEARAYAEIGENVRGEFLISNIAKTDFADIFHYEDTDTWYKCKLTYVTADADSEKERKVSNQFLVTASSVKEAFDRVHECMKGMVVSFEIPMISLSPIVDVFPFNEDFAPVDREIERKPMEAIDERASSVAAGYFSASDNDEDDEDSVNGEVENEYIEDEEE